MSAKAAKVVFKTTSQMESSPCIEKVEIINKIGITAMSCMIKIPNTLRPYGLVISRVSLKVFNTIAVEDNDNAAPIIIDV
jgi:hypothetical protein